MKALIIKEFRDYWSNSFGLISVAVLLLLTFLFLWIFPDSNYLSYGLSEGDLYFQFFSYLLLFAVPAYTVGFLANEYRYGTEELLRSLQIDWKTALLAKFVAALLVLMMILILSSTHLIVIYQLNLNVSTIPFFQILGSYIGLIGVGACYVAISLMVTSFVQQTTASFVISVFVCFMLFSGFSLLSDLPIFQGDLDFWLERLSLSYHADQIGRGILRSSSIVYFIGLVTWSIWLASFRLNTKEV